METATAGYSVGTEAFLYFIDELSEDEDVLGELEREAKALNDPLSCVYSLYQKTKDKTDLNHALRIMEGHRAIFMTHSLNEVRNQALGTIPIDLMNLGDSLKTQKALLQTEFLSATSSKEKFKLNFELDQVEQEIKNWKIQTEAFQVPIHSIRQQELTIEEIQNSVLDPGELLLEYYDGGEELFVLAISTSKVDFIRSDLPEGFGETLETYYSALAHPEEQEKAKTDFLRTSPIVFEGLLGKVVSAFEGGDIDRVIIVPDGKLTQIPFSSLLVEKREEINYRFLPYLVRYCEIQTVWSSQLLAESRRNARPASNWDCLGLAWSKVEEETPFSHLYRGADYSEIPGTGKELELIEEIMKGSYYWGEEATEKLFKENAWKYGIIHLAMHGLGKEQPAIIFRSGGGEKEDGKLYLHEIANLRLNAGLVVLSSCNSGQGKIRKGEGAMSIERGFALADCPAILSNLWEVEDQASLALMESFYPSIRSGDDHVAALRKAQLEYLKEADAQGASPNYWAGWKATGQSSLNINF